MLKNQAPRAFLVSILLSIALPFVPILKWGLYPFDLLNTHLHEFFHAITAVLTGGSVVKIIVSIDSQGLTLTRGGFVPLILMAGYLGASLFGALMVMLCRSERSTTLWLRVLGSIILVSNVIWVRGDIVGWIFGVAWAAAIFYASIRITGPTLVYLAQFLAVQQCLNSVKSLRDLVILSNSNVMTDAQLLAERTHIPALFFALLWTLVGVFGIGAAVLKLGQSKAPAEPVASEP